MMRSRHLAAWLLLWTATSPSFSLDLGKLIGGGKRATQQPKVTRSVSATPLDYDASTGTVVANDHDQGTTTVTGMTCDTLMAKSLVLANEAKALAEEQMAAAVKGHRQAEAVTRNLQDELETTRTTLTQQVQTLTETLESTRSQAAEQLNQLELDKQTQLAAMAQQLHELGEEANANMTKAREAWDEARALHAKEANEQIQLTQQKATNAIAEMEKERDRKVAEVTQAMENLITKTATDMATLKEETDLKIANLERQHQQAQEEKDAEMARVKKQAEDLAALVKEEAGRNVTQAQLDAQELIARKVEEHAIANNETALKIANLIRQHQDAQEEKDAEMARVQKEAEELAVSVKEEADRKVTQVQADTQDLIARKEEEHATSLAQLRQTMQENEQKASDKLKAVEDDAARRLSQIEDDAKKEMTIVLSTHQKKVRNLDASIAEMKDSVKMWQKRYEILDKKYKNAESEIEQWEALHGARSYCNFTHLQEDFILGTYVAQQAVSEHLSAVVDHAAKATRQVAEKASDATAPLVRKYYDNHAKAHVDKHVMPVFDRHVLPILNGLFAYQKQINLQLRQWVSRSHDELVAQYKIACPQVRKQIRKWKAPDFVIDRVQQDCREPKQSVNRYMKIMIVLLVIIFRSFLWRTLWTIVFLPFRIMWFLSPLRLLFGSKKLERQNNAEGRQALSSTTDKPLKVKSSPSQ